MLDQTTKNIIIDKIIELINENNRQGKNKQAYCLSHNLSDDKLIHDNVITDIAYRDVIRAIESL